MHSEIARSLTVAARIEKPEGTSPSARSPRSHAPPGPPGAQCTRRRPRDSGRTHLSLDTGPPIRSNPSRDRKGALGLGVEQRALPAANVKQGRVYRTGIQRRTLPYGRGSELSSDSNTLMASPCSPTTYCMAAETCRGFQSHRVLPWRAHRFRFGSSNLIRFRWRLA